MVTLALQSIFWFLIVARLLIMCRMAIEERNSLDDVSYVSKITVFFKDLTWKLGMRIKTQAAETKNKDTLLPSSVEA